MPAGAPGQYPDPIQPQIDLNDVLAQQTMPIGSATVTWANAANSAPSVPQTRFTLPDVGLASAIYLEFDGGSATAYDLTIGAGAAAAVDEGPFSIVDGYSLVVNGGTGFYEVSGFGAKLLNDLESDFYSSSAEPGPAFNTAPTAIASRLFNYPVAADGRPRFGVIIPLSVSYENPLGMILVQNPTTTVDLVIRWASLSGYATLTAGAVAALSLTVTATLEYYEMPPRPVFDALVRPELRWAHQFIETRQAINGVGRDANTVSLDVHDTYLRIAHLVKVNNLLDTDDIDGVRFTLNRTIHKYDHSWATHARRQRRFYGKDVPAVIWDQFATRTMRDAIHADGYTDLGSKIDLSSATVLGAAGTNFIRTITEKLVDLDSVA